jgi:divalent metal cation (Fe/Co/Zn/Cd) transporter
LDPGTIRKIVLSFEKVKAAHNIRSRGSKSYMHIDMHHHPYIIITLAGILSCAFY